MATTHQDRQGNWISGAQTRSSSLKQRLLIRIGIVLLATWIVAALATKFSAKSSTRDFLYQHTQHLAQSWVETLSQQTFHKITLSSDSSQLLNGWVDDDMVIEQGPLKLEKPTGSTTYIKTIDSVSWIISTACNGNICALVGLRDKERRYAVRRLVVFIFLPLLIIFSLAMVGMYRAVQSGLKPLNELTQDVSKRSPTSLTELPSCNAKSYNIINELIPLSGALNLLIKNLKYQLVTERQFLDTCTHELKTPVTAMIAQIQTLQTDDNHLNQQLAKVQQSALRTTRVASQFLHLGKAQNAETLSQQKEVFDLSELIRQIICDKLNYQPYTDIQFQGEPTLVICAEAFAIETLCHNLIDNALLHGQADGDQTNRIIIDCHRYKHEVTVTVEDNGKGVASEHREKLVKRFYRAENQKSLGAGLGLSIVNEIVQHYQGKIILDKSPMLGGFSASAILHIPS